MGMAMNRFDMFCQLRDDMKMSGKFNQFVLSAVIVHDNSDTKLVSEIKANFINWAELTGERFLFVTFVPPSGAWRKSKYCSDTYWVNKSTLMADHHLSRRDEEATNSLLRDFMGLPSRGSYIVLADKLDSVNLCSIPTSAASIAGQLEMVTRYCNGKEERLPSHFNRLLQDLNGVKQKTRKSFIDSLIDYTSLISPLNAFGRHFGKNRQRGNAARVLNSRLSELERLDEEAYFEGYSQLSAVAEVAIKNSSRNSDWLRGPGALEYINNDGFRLLSDYSQTLYKTYRFLERILTEHQELILPFNLDYSFLTVNLGKIIEYELNLSILQMLRFVMGIEMPSYYNRFSLRNGDIEIPAGNTTVKINCPLDAWGAEASDLSPLKGIPIGNLMYAYEDMAVHPETIPPAADITRLIRISEKALRFFKRFSSRYRNKASHIDLRSAQTYEEAKAAFQEFMTEHLPVLCEIKATLNSPWILGDLSIFRSV